MTEAAEPMAVWDPEARGWAVGARVYGSLRDAAAAIEHPTLGEGGLPHAAQNAAAWRLSNIGRGGASAYEVLGALADLLDGLIVREPLGVGSPAAEVRSALAACHTRLRQAQDAVGEPPTPIDGPF